ncbi:MAG TPA: zf-HC2 domain-containing protein [Candidatus Aminicenantes bacterium]|nr:zf-HC2 domain-containing protein [Candidatus Aminicenantes bacterium]HRY64191.1 zf-HC2 domain-containing protein [Candidatus Aminicenantes bacterium]HRZ71104.1 zf-HC2 domain-containing protein [Candidatus Aminicenantes bacterium]
MSCRKAEKLIQRSLDGRLDRRGRDRLASHLAVCPACRKVEAEYRSMLRLLKDGPAAEPLPRFWERLEPRLREETELVPLLFWERWSLKAIPVFLALVILLGGFLFFAPRTRELSQSAVLLMENRDPLSETQALFETDRPETRTMMLLFASREETSPARRPMP